ncbi:MAG: hypothetical protein ACREDR_31850 [Blastocatellia bacterium]
MNKLFGWTSIAAAGLVAPLLCFQLLFELMRGGGMFLDDMGGRNCFGQYVASVWYCSPMVSPLDRLAMIALSIFALYVTAVWVERLLTFMRSASQSDKLRPLVFDALRFGTCDTAVDSCLRFNKCPEAAVANSILAELDDKGAAVTRIERVKLASKRSRRAETAKLRQGIPNLKLIAAVSPLISLVAAGLDAGREFYDAVALRPIEGAVSFCYALSHSAVIIVYGLTVSVASLCVYGFLSRGKARIESALDDFTDDLIGRSLSLPPVSKSRHRSVTSFSGKGASLVETAAQARSVTVRKAEAS